MAKQIPTELAGVLSGNEQGKADGRLRHAGLRSDRNTFVIDGTDVTATTSDTLSLGYARAGQCTRAFQINASANMSAASIAIGTAADPDKYLAAAALPNATSARRVVPASAEGYDPIDAEEEIIVTISAATIANGTLTIDREYTQR